MITRTFKQTKTTSSTRRSTKGFTLIELLVVIAIIGLLASISFGPIMNFLSRGKETESKQMAKDLEFAISQFQDDYTHLPYSGTLDTATDTKVITNDAAFLKVLMGLEPDDNSAVNDRGQEYFTAKRAQNRTNGLVYEGDIITKLVDHWRQPFVIVLDTDSDGIIEESQIYSGSDKKHNKQTAIIATGGRDKEFNKDHDITSW